MGIACAALMALHLSNLQALCTWLASWAGATSSAEPHDEGAAAGPAAGCAQVEQQGRARAAVRQPCDEQRRKKAQRDSGTAVSQAQAEVAAVVRGRRAVASCTAWLCRVVTMVAALVSCVPTRAALAALALSLPAGPAVVGRVLYAVQWHACRRPVQG